MLNGLFWALCLVVVNVVKKWLWLAVFVGSGEQFGCCKGYINKIGGKIATTCNRCIFEFLDLIVLFARICVGSGCVCRWCLVFEVEH